MERKVRIWEQKKASLFISGCFKMRIALCDWDRKFVETVKNMIYIYAEHFRIDIVADCYDSGETLTSSGINYNMIFLGYRLNGINGMKTAENIRRSNSDTAIIFVSEYTDFVFEAFKVTPYRFLIKPLSRNTLFETLNDYFKRYGTDYPLWLRCGEDTVCLNTNEIYFLEADNKHCFVHLKGEILSCNRTMARVFGVLPKNHFSKINRAFVVNLNFVEKYNNEQIFLKNGQSIHISRNYLKAFKDEYRRFSNPREP